jgi:hypothetical protein
MRYAKALTFIVAALVVTGCGGGGGTADFESSFQGIWAGTWSSTSLALTGTASIIVAEDGTFTGTSNIDGGSSGGNIIGSIDNDGFVTGTVQYSGQSASAISGTLGTTNGTNLTGTLVQTISSTNYNVSYDLTLQ